MNLYVVRHGKTDWNIDSKIQGKTNIKLNKIGINQAEEIGELLRNKNLDLIISSTLDRAKQTAEIINKNLKIPIKYSEGLKERNFGVFEGKTSTEVEDWKSFLKYYENKEIKEGERIQDFFGRVFKSIEEIEKKYKDKNILIVTHGGVARAIDCYFNGIPEDKENTGKGMLSNCEIREYKK